MKDNAKRALNFDDEIVIVSENIPNPPQLDDDIIIVSHKKWKKPRFAEPISRANRPNSDDVTVETSLKSSNTPNDMDSNVTTTSVPSPTPAVPLVSRFIDCSICKHNTPRCESVIIGPCECAACRTCMTKRLTTVTKLPLQCTGCCIALDTWKAVAEIAWQNKEAGARLERLAIVAMMGENIKLCHACSAPFEYSGDGTKQHAKVVCPLCAESTCVLCGMKWHIGVCVFPCPSCATMSNATGVVVCKCGVRFCTRCGVDCGKVTKHRCVHDRNVVDEEEEDPDFQPDQHEHNENEADDEEEMVGEEYET